MDSIRPLRNYNGGIVLKAVLNGTLGTVVYASNYNDLDNKPSINSVELRGNKTAEDLGLATPADITVKSVNNQTGDVSLTGQNIPYDSKYSVTEKINDLESQITDSGVTSVNGKTGVVNLTGTDINYSTGVTLNAKIDAVENEIPEVNYPVTSVNGKTGAVVLAGSDIEYSAGVSINTQIENVAGEISDLTAEDIPMSGTDSTPTATAIGDLSQLTTTEKSSLVGAVNEVDSDLSNLPTEIRCGGGNYSGLKGGGHPNRVSVPITFSKPMTGTQYAVFIVVSDAYSDYPYIQGYCFGGSRTVNGFTATILSMSSDTTTEVSGSFYWVAVRYK